MTAGPGVPSRATATPNPYDFPVIEPSRLLRGREWLRSASAYPCPHNRPAGWQARGNITTSAMGRHVDSLAQQMSSLLGSRMGRLCYYG